MKFKDQREFLALLEKEGELKRIKAPISNKGREVGALCHLMQQNGQLAAIAENPVDVNVKAPLVIAPFQSYKKCAIALRTTEYWDAVNKLAGLITESVKEPAPKIVKDAPCKEVVIKGEDIDLRKQIPQIHWEEGEHRNYLTGALSFTKEPETGVYNVGWYRYTFLEADLDGKPFSEETQKREMLAYAYPVNHLGQHLAKSLERGKPLEVAIAVGVDPSLYVISCTAKGEEIDDLVLSGALMGEPLEMVKCETVDLEVPASSEYVIEGEIIDRRMDDGHFPGWLGYYDRSPNLPVFRVKCITHRKDPMMWGEPELAFASFEQIWQLGRDGGFLGEARRLVPEITQVYSPAPAAGLGVIVRIGKKPYKLFAQRVMHALWACHANQALKYVVVVDEDIDPTNAEQVWWAIVTRAQPYEDFMILRDAPTHHRDPSHGGAAGRVSGSVVGIDATIKYPERFAEPVEVIKVSDDILQKVEAKIKPEFK